MADCNNLFREFNNIIKLDDEKKGKLLRARNLLREDIIKHMHENKPDEIMPKFHGQGSYKMDTIINPIPDEDGNVKYDLDDGIYFKGDISSRKSPQTYHKWICDAVDGRTKSKEDKNTCVRVIYAAGHHIDLPIYFIVSSNIPELAHKEKEWIQSDPKAFYEWFNNEAKYKSKLREIVRFFKAWCDKKNKDNSSVKMPSGMIMTILATQSYHNDDRYDLTFFKTLEAMTSKLKSNFSCYRPTVPIENLFDDFSDTRKNHFLRSLESFLDSASKAIENPNQKNACLQWQKNFGDRFSCATAKDELEESNKYETPAVITSSAKSGMV